jgi:hypothetical protein
MDVLNLQSSKLILGCLCGKHYCHCANLYLLAWDTPKDKQHATHLWQLSSSKLDGKYMVGMLVLFRHSNQECFVSEKSSMASYVSPKGWNVVA